MECESSKLPGNGRETWGGAGRVGQGGAGRVGWGQKGGASAARWGGAGPEPSRSCPATVPPLFRHCPTFGRGVSPATSLSAQPDCWLPSAPLASELQGEHLSFMVTACRTWCFLLCNFVLFLLLRSQSLFSASSVLSSSTSSEVGCPQLLLP